MSLFYNLGIYGMVAGLKIASLFNAKARKWVVGRRGVFDELSRAINDEKQPVVWIHAASLGEFEQGRPIIESIRTRMPGHKILLTFFSPSGYEIRKNYSGADWIFYLPADTPRNAKRFLDIVKPQITIFIKYEFWLNFLNKAKSRGSRLFLISAIFLPDFVFFKSYGGGFRKTLKSFEKIFVQNADSQRLLKGINVENVAIAGDTRFDRVYDQSQKSLTIPIIEKFAADSKVLVAGSTWEQDERILLELIKVNTDCKFIIAPHEIHPERIDQFISDAGVKGLRYTQLTESSEVTDATILFIDTIGILSSVYKYGSMAYIGGGFGAGIHNILEAATFGLPIAFGPNFRKFAEAKDLIDLGGALSIQDVAELLLWFSEANTSQGDICKRYVESRIGATKMILNQITSK